MLKNNKADYTINCSGSLKTGKNKFKVKMNYKK